MEGGNYENSWRYEQYCHSYLFTDIQFKSKKYIYNFNTINYYWYSVRNG